jgi:hypothetical protein
LIIPEKSSKPSEHRQCCLVLHPGGNVIFLSICRKGNGAVIVRSIDPGWEVFKPLKSGWGRKRIPTGLPG